MKISVFYEHIEKACEQTKKPLEEVLAHVKKSGIDGIEMDYDMLSSEDDEQSILTSLKKAGLVISSIYGFCHLDAVKSGSAKYYSRSSQSSCLCKRKECHCDT